MRSLILAALAAATALSGIALPAAADAQSRYEHRQDRRGDWRRGDHRRMDRHEVRRYGRDHRWGRDDWRGYRDHNRRLYARGNWRAPFRYNRFGVGARIAPGFYGPRYVIADPWRYRLPPARRGLQWVRHYDDVLLVDRRRGRVVQVVRGFYW